MTLVRRSMIKFAPPCFYCRIFCMIVEQLYSRSLAPKNVHKIDTTFFQILRTSSRLNLCSRLTFQSLKDLAEAGSKDRLLCEAPETISNVACVTSNSSTVALALFCEDEGWNFHKIFMALCDERLKQVGYEDVSVVLYE